jgi:hypothetical protein
VQAILVGIPVEAEIDVSEDYSAVAPESVDAILRTAAPRAQELFRLFIEQLRCDRQHKYLRSGSPSFEQATAVAAGLYDHTGRRLPYGFLRMGSIEFRTLADALERQPAESMLDAAIHGQTVALPSTFLADAAASRDIKHAVLLAAVACEVAVKTTLTDRADGSQAALLELLLNRPRDYSMAAASLFHEPCGIILGRSLKVANPELYRRICELFED